MKGPEPITSSICLAVGVSATRLGIMKGTPTLGLPKVSSIRPYFSLSTIWKVCSSTTR